MNNESVQSTTANGGSGVSKTVPLCRAIFFRTFNLADFFDKRLSDDASSSDNVPLAFLKQRTWELSRCLFTNRKQKKPGQDITTPLYEYFWRSEQSEKPATNWKFSADIQKEEDQAYDAGWVRGTLLDAFFAPTYEYKKPNEKGVCGIIPSDQSCEPVCSIYREHWFKDGRIPDWLGKADLYLALSPYGIASVRLEVEVPIEEIRMGIGEGLEFQYVQNQLASLFSSDSATSELKKVFQKADGYPSLLSFIALSAIWNFVNELKEGVSSVAESQQEPPNLKLKDWWKALTDPRLGNLNFRNFSEVWERCIYRPFPLRHEAVYYYFEHERYMQKLWVVAPTEVDLDSIIRLGLLVSPQEPSTEQSEELFAKDVRQNLDKTDLCVTDNGYAFMVGSSLIVAAKYEKYRIQGNDDVEERAYWRWMFRLLCCLKECFMLCDISSRDVRKLREQYESERDLCFKAGENPTPDKLERFEREGRRLLDELARVASLLFTVEEGTHAVAASRVLFVQEKFKSFVDHLALSDLLDNVNNRRQRLEQRLHDEMSRILQGRMERLAEATEKTAEESKQLAKKAHEIGLLALVFAIVATIAALYSLKLAKDLDGYAHNLVEYVKDLDQMVKQAVEKLKGPETNHETESPEQMKSQGKQAQDSVHPGK